MWTDTTRAFHARSGLALPSDLTDAEWAVLEPLLPAASHVGRPRKWPMRRIADTFGASFRSQHADGCDVGVQDVATQDRCPDLVDHRLQDPHRAATPIGKRAAWDVCAHARQNLVLPVQRQVIVELRDQHVSQETSSGHAARDRSARGWRLDHLLAATAGLLWAGNFDDLELCRDHLEDLAHVFADETQVAPAIRTGAAGVEFVAFVRRIRRDARAPGRTQPGVGLGRSGCGLRFRIVLVACHEPLLRDGDEHVFKGKLELLDLAFDLLGGFAEGLLPEPGDL